MESGAALEAVQAILDAHHANLLASNEPGAVLRALAADLEKLQTAAAAAWAGVTAACRTHPICARLHEDPLTRHAFARPRGYAGDAALMDVIYDRHWGSVSATAPTTLGQQIFATMIEEPDCAAVRGRKQFLAEVIDETCARQPSARILSVACGHLRELHRSRAVRAREFQRFVGLDQDALTIATVGRELGPLGVEAVRADVADILRGRYQQKDMTLVYSAGLYDYLDARTARALTRRLFSMLLPGGRLLIANFTRAGCWMPYREVFLRWPLVYRTFAELSAVASDIPPEALGSRRVFRDETGHIAYLELCRR